MYVSMSRLRVAAAESDALVDAFRRRGHLVDTFDGLIEALPLMSRMPMSGMRRGTVGVVTTTGGGATTVVDPLSVRGVVVEPPSAATLAHKAAGAQRVDVLAFALVLQPKRIHI